MKMTFRWYGNDDPVTLQKIRQIPRMSGIVSAIYDVPVGEVWPVEKIEALKKTINDAGLEFEVVESVPVHEDIKLGNPGSDRLIENYCENIRRLGAAGVKCVCYNFMPVFDWLRSELEHQMPDGCNALAYSEAAVRAMDPTKTDLVLPGWDASYTKEQVRGLIEQYQKLGEEGLWSNVERFLKAVIPVAEVSGVNMAIHPDDPPWGMFGLPRIITNRENLRRFLKLVDSPANGLTFCTGSLGAGKFNDLTAMIDEFCDRIHFAHLRNIAYTEDGFCEVGHPTECGSLDMYSIMRHLVDGGFDGYIRPDHGRMIWGETGKYGYGLYDRALGAVYLTGLWEGIVKTK